MLLNGFFQFSVRSIWLWYIYQLSFEGFMSYVIPLTRLILSNLLMMLNFVNFSEIVLFDKGSQINLTLIYCP